MSSALISECGKFRYDLRRRWAVGGSRVLFVMLNPSTADGREDDATIRRCVGFARSWGHGSLLVGNLFAFRATSPSELHRAHRAGTAGDAVINLNHVRSLARDADQVVCAWGANASEYAARVLLTLDVLRLAHPRLWCLGRTADGHPRHPVRLAGSTPLVLYPEGKWQ